MGLTHIRIEKATPRNDRFELTDGNGLSLRIMPSGNRSWIYRYRFDARPRRLTLGAYPALSLAEARSLHAQAMQDIQRGVDPGRKKAEAKHARKAAPTMNEL